MADQTKRHTGGIGDAPIQEEYRQKMNDLARLVDEYLNGPLLPGVERNIGFVLMCFPFNDDTGRCNYISNSVRADIKVLLREQLRRFEGQAKPKPGKA